jgi:uncharacterized protein (UPF0147 family)
MPYPSLVPRNIQRRAFDSAQENQQKRNEESTISGTEKINSARLE